MDAQGSVRETVFAFQDGRLSPAAADIARGTMRLLAALSFAPVLELTLASGRRADIGAIGPKGELWIVEIKSCLNDYRSDTKWHEYYEYCDRLYFAVDSSFPVEILPADAGVIVADRFGAAVMRDAAEDRLSAARRKSATLNVARAASQRLHGLIDPGRIENT